ncbi:HK97 family phage prohead protease [Bacillus wiedmannii]|uniref:HK97 family phage prohead protease n=1 Tax=Bacillus wiedmannii TaxID=1890302 RepID=UPI000BFD961C|nr:HK97 family phage prohead protease [Bacillus wiedmannii]PHD29928.1 hypothetical protein COF58_01115 [Bacillus wiedmannii]
MTINKMELRFNEFELNKNEHGELKVSGYVNKTNQWSQVLGNQKKFVERVLPGTFNKAIQNGNEIHFLAEHENAKILSSTRNGSLNLREDENGLYMEATISDTSWGRDYHTLIKDGIIQNMSFGMQVTGDTWNKRSDGIYERSISDLYLAEVSAVRNPAYVQSTIQARSIEVIEDVDIPEENDTEDKSMVKEKRELTAEEQIEVNNFIIKGLQRLVDLDGDVPSKERIEKLKSENRSLQAQLPVTQNPVAQETETKEERALQTIQTPGWLTVKTDLIREQAKKMNGKHSIVSRTNIIIQEGGELNVLLEDAENYNKDISAKEMGSINLDDYTAQKVKIQTARMGTGIEVSELLMEKSYREDQVKASEQKLRARSEDGINAAMFRGFGSMESLNADSSVSNIISTAKADEVSLKDALTLIGKTNQEYREDAVFIMHTELFNQILTNVEFKDHLEFTIDEFSGKKLYHLIGFPMLVNDNADKKRIIFGSLYNGYKTLISIGPKPHLGTDIYGNKAIIDRTSFKLQVTRNTEKALKGSVVHSMDVHIGGKVINKDCFARLDVKTV